MAQHQTHSTVPCSAGKATPTCSAFVDFVVFADLSVKEFLQVGDYMSNIPGMSILCEPAAFLSADYLYLIDLSLPKQQDILAHLDADTLKPR